MIKMIKLIATLLILLNLTNTVLADSSFFEEGKKSIMKKNIRNQNFCFKEALFLTPKTQVHICI